MHGRPGRQHSRHAAAKPAQAPTIFIDEDLHSEHITPSHEQLELAARPREAPLAQRGEAKVASVACVASHRAS